MFATLFQLMGTMFFLMLVGALLRFTGLIDNRAKKSLTDIILYAILPCNIIKAFSSNVSGCETKEFVITLAIAIAVQMMALFISKFMYGFVENGKKEVYQYGTVCSNSGFLGNPIAEGVFGTTGLVYASVFLIPQRIVMWSAGVSFFSKEENRAATYKKVLTHPCMIATYIGMLIMIFNLKIPMFINGAVTALSNCTTAMTMVYVGTILVDINIKKLINRQQIYFSFIRLVVMPLIVYVVCYFAHIDSLITGVCVLLTGMPAGSTTSLLASKYGSDEDSAAQSVVFTTILSIISIPIWSAILLNNI